LAEQQVDIRDVNEIMACIVPHARGSVKHSLSLTES